MLTYGAIRKGGVKVSLDGHGADECFAGYLFDARQGLADAGMNPALARGIMDAYYKGRPASSQFPLPSRGRFFLSYNFV